MLQAVANIGTDAAAIIPESMLIEFTEARQSGSAELYQSFCAYLDAQVSKAVLGQTLTTEIPQGAGSRAAAEVHDSVRRDIMSADARRLAATLNRDLIKPIVDLNLGRAETIRASTLGIADDTDVSGLRGHREQARRPRRAHRAAHGAAIDWASRSRTRGEPVLQASRRLAAPSAGE